MTIEKTIVQQGPTWEVVNESAKCECGTVLRYNGHKTSSGTQYEHFCERCLTIVVLDGKYPRVVVT